jgi:hypothetical protein
MRSWRKRGVATPGGRTGFVKQAIRTELLDQIEVDSDPDRAADEAYARSIYQRVEAEIQAGMERLAAKRRLPVLG